MSFIPHFNNWQKYSLRVYYYDRVTSTGYSGTDTWIEFEAPIQVTWKQEKTRLSSMDGEIRDFNEGWRGYVKLSFSTVTQELYDNIEIILEGISRIESEGHPLGFSIRLPSENVTDPTNVIYSKMDNLLLDGDISFVDIIQNLAVGQTTEINLIKDFLHTNLQTWKPTFTASKCADEYNDQLIDDSGNSLIKVS